ncbi:MULTISPECIES: adenosine deaminase [unclassified Streptomyces]|uniref:adenosine deaminase n=1 Tax=unclassified Streptomyces TaxID=2593676 RepID=UPI0001C1A757|nr:MULTISPECIES: adenosine deaminase [unclassified Streptomyces]AEN13875.1 adenosine deaminase [Streptomyces sp. SirexAA-E]MYR67893.1 adenosine deaminase [Streptomyces sp. SID4939]MYS00280.1 adenosine deaminase [Streptomyces sp. SID4940]MYT67764.1 adenosine deaminase [Streptomyces sp. SID8357]MYT86608.1 adenosine deaminase [Streptomyces sp. SID8360]
MVSAKIELHVHLEGAIRPATLLEIARRNGEVLPADTVEGLEALYRFTDFRHFLSVWRMTTNCLRTADDFRRVVVNYAQEAREHGAVYLEAIFSPAERVESHAIDWDEMFTGYTEGAVEAQERFGVAVRFTPDLYRGCPVELAEECARVSVRYRDRGVVGLGIGGDERRSTLAPYGKAIRIAQEGGLAFVPHAGEVGGPECVREALDLGAVRLRHGIRAVEEPGLLEEIAGRGVVLDVCPTSNLRTGVVKDIAAHPLPLLHAAGVRCSVNTDDPAMFGTDLGQEHELAARFGVTADHAYAAGLAGALCEDEVLTRLQETARPV